jgi:amino acid adenylation domain-containing protein
VEIQLCVEGDGTIDAADLFAALTEVGHRCPGTRLVRRGRRWVDSGVPPVVRIAEPDALGRPRLDSALLNSRLALRDSPTCEVVLLPGTPTAVVFRAHHGVMDAKGVMFWLTQVFRALRGEPVVAATSRLTANDVLAEIASAQGRELPPMAGPQAVRWQPLLGPLPGPPYRVLRRRRTIDGYHPGAAAKVAREVTAYGDGTGIVLVPVDLRPFRPSLRTTGQASGSVKILVGKNEDWINVQASLLRSLSEHQFLANRADSALLKLPLPWLRSVYQWLDRRYVADGQFMVRTGVDFLACVSHIGRAELADVSAGGFAATSCYSVVDAMLVPNIDIVESGGRTNISLGWRDGPGVAEHAEALLDRIEERLSPRGHRDWDSNRADREAPTLISLFADQVRRTPGTTAISGPDGDMTYAELDRRASAVAAALRSRGLGRGDLIGLVAGRSPATIVAVWGVLKAGAAYIPIDATYPDARIAQFLADAKAPACLLEPAAGQRDCLPPGCAGIDLETLPQMPPDGWQDASGDPGDLAYVVYTSGSTGAPKGVEIEHRSVVSYVRWATREAGIDGTTRMLLIPSISFDVAGCAFFLPLLAGGAVLPVRDVNAVTLRAAIEGTGATAMAITPSHLDIINRAGVRRTTMRVVMTIGEVLRRTTAVRAREILGPECRILNQYGPAETTIVNTSHEFDPETDTDPGVPFGLPMDGNTVHILDSYGRFVTPGEPGEAYIGGSQVGRGYLGRPDLTRQRFVRLADGSRVYRTGDIVRLLPCGELTFVSRVDDQVKVAGHRIEPAEIAQVLESHPRIRQAAVVPRTRPGREDKELCAYVVCDDGTEPDGWRDYLASRLPRYMVPAALTAVAEIPLNPNGKVDARRLPDPFDMPAASAGDDASVRDDGEGSAERDDVTAAVAAIWALTLRIDRHLIDEKADFHRLGGNSLLLLSMIGEVASSVVEGGQAEFMDEIGRIIREPTLAEVSVLVREIADRKRMETEGKRQVLAGPGPGDS